MKYLSIDIETSGLDSENNQILSIGAIVEDTENRLSFDDIPKFHVCILADQLTGSPFALNMNRELIKTMVHYQTTNEQDEKNDLVHMTGMQFLQRDNVVEEFYDFLFENGFVQFNTDIGHTVKVKKGKTYPIMTSKMKPASINVAGKNFGTFDKLFLERLPRWKQAIRIRQRIIDPSILFTDWKNDIAMPSLDTCKVRARLDGVVTHNAIEDAWDVIQLLRTQY